MLGRVGELLADGVQHPGEPGLHLVGVGLVEHGANQGSDPRLRRFGDLGEQVAQVVGAAALSAGAG